MSKTFSRRSLFQIAGAAALLRSGISTAQQQAPSNTPRTRPASAPPLDFPELTKRSSVGLIHGEDRRKNAYNALMAIDKELQPKLVQKKYVVIKPNCVSTQTQLAASHVDAMCGIVDYISERFKGPIVIAESSAGNTFDAFDNFNYNRLITEFPQQKIELIDLNKEAKYEIITLLDPDLHPTPTRLAARLFDPDAFVICSAMLKTHNTVIATLSLKNMILGAPLHQSPDETLRWSDKRKYHVGLRQTHYNMLLTAMKMKPFWGATLIDGFEGMEGRGPGSGTLVASKIAIASTDYVAADRIGAEAMGINPEWLGYLVYSGQVGIGQYDISKIDVIGASLADVKKPYEMHPDIEQELLWQGPMEDVPLNLGWMSHPRHHSEYLLG